MIDPVLLPIIIFAMAYYDLGEHGVTWDKAVEVWNRTYLPALQEEHFGDCIKQPQTCIRCQAEDCIRMASIIMVGEGLRTAHKRKGAEVVKDAIRD